MRLLYLLRILLLAVIVSLHWSAPVDCADSIAKASDQQASGVALLEGSGQGQNLVLSGDINVGMHMPFGAKSLATVDSSLTLGAATGEADFRYVTTKDGVAQFGFSLSNTVGEIQYRLWDGKWSERSWGDPTGLVRLTGSGQQSARLRITMEEYSLDLGAGHAASRWERQFSNNATKTTLGWLAMWGDSNLDADEDDEQCDSATGWNEDEDNCSWNEEGTDYPNSDTDDDDSILPAKPLAFDRATAYASINKGGWKWQAAIAGAAGEAGSNAGNVAAAFVSSFKSQAWRMEWKAESQPAGFRTSGDAPLYQAQGLIAGATGSFAAEVKAKWQSVVGDGPATTWRLTVGGRKQATASSMATLFSDSQLERAKSLAWRLQTEWKLASPSKSPKTCAGEACPWLVANEKIANWKAGIEGVSPFLGGAVIVRLMLGESKTGRMNWWQTDPLGVRVLSAQSDTALSFAVRTLHRVGNTSSLHISAAYAEDVQFDPKPWETSQAAYWLVQPKLTRAVNEQLDVEYSLSWYGGHSYSGIAYRYLTPAVQVKMYL